MRRKTPTGVFYRSKTFLQKKNAEKWVYKMELALESGEEPDKLHTVLEAIKRYQLIITPNKKGKKWENTRLEKFKTYPITRKYIQEVIPDDMIKWRDERLKNVSSATVLREIKLWSSIFTAAWKEWRWINDNPCFHIRKPSKAPDRERIITSYEKEMLLARLRRSRVKYIFELALETGMRVSEMTGLTQAQVKEDHVILIDTKNGTQRTVPLSQRAKQLVEHVPFGISSGSVSGVFARAAKDLGLDDLTFHDTRHTAATRLANKLSVLELCRMFGWRDPHHAMIYFNPPASDLAEKLKSE